uniref:Uncharacterized protein n=1 Tax=Timema bartmani TaxID=61472 RepID=A0A7R9I159_9NEOP|nr:unnamed protein product [Timema bartmani]
MREKNNAWRKVRAQKGVAVPRGRRGHSALIHRGTMLVYGGYQDLRGSSNELWGFHFGELVDGWSYLAGGAHRDDLVVVLFTETESWHLLSSPAGRMGSSGGGGGGELPPARHKHSAILHDDAIWVYGGMTDLQERADLWRWDTVSKTWLNVRSKPGPGALHSHAACKLPSSMLLFGGERDGHPTNELWRFHFGTETWERLQVSGVRPHPRAESVALTVSELLLEDPVTPPSSTFTKPSAASHSLLRGHRSRGGGSVDRTTNLHPRHSSYLPNNRVSPCEKKYVFTPVSGNYVDGSQDDTGARRRCYSVHQQGVGVTPNGSGFLREISKLSQINLSRLSHHKCSYSVLTSSSHDESTESLLLQPSSASEDQSQQPEEVQGTPSKMVKSQSTSVITRRKPMVSPERPTVLVTQHHGGCARSSVHRPVAMAHDPESDGNGLTRDPTSVPNFGTLGHTLPTPVLTPVEITKLVYLDTDDEMENDVFGSGDPSSQGRVIQVRPSTVNTDFAALHQRFQPSLQGEGGTRSESYNSHLLSAGYADSTAPSCHITYKSSGIPKSASVRFRAGHQVADLEENSDETVSTSDYASIASVSNYSMYNRPSPVDPHFQHDHQTDECNNGRFGKPTNGKVKTPSREGPFGFCNPNYLGPDIQTILASAGQRKSWHVSTPTSGDQDCAVHKKQFQSFAQLLNSPPDSVLEDASGRSISRQFCADELVELQNMDQSPSLATPPAGRNPPQYLALAPSGGLDRRKKCRASSASRAEKTQSSASPLEIEDQGHLSMVPPVALYVFLLGGKEQGQVTVFKRPMSVWKLQLAKNVF